MANQVINLSNLNGSNGFTINGINSGDFAGNSVSNAGDINGDGIDDLIIGANEADPNGNRSGQSYIIFGSLSGFDNNFNLSNLDGTNGFTINGIGVGDNLGSSVSSAGDINGDGIDDLLIGSRFADPNGNASGKSYVVFGSINPFGSIFDLQTLNGTNGFSINGIGVNDRSGSAVSNAGDVNGDGIYDLIIGAYFANANGSLSGESYVVFGSRDTFNSSIELSSLNGSNGFKINGISPSDTSGYSVSGAGDINGDGINDLIIGARDADTNGVRSGESYVVFGQDSPFSSTLELSDLNGSNGFKIIGLNEFDRSGASVSNAGDVNGDGIDDLIIGAEFADSNGVVSGESYVVFGSTNPFSSTLELSSLNGNNGFAIIGINAGDSAGSSVSNAGDVNGDGIDDIIIGAASADPNGFLSGESYVVFGSNNQFSSRVDLSDLNGSNGFVIEGGDADDRSGGAVSSAGDINGDGIDDIIIGAIGADANGGYSGKSFVVFGNSAPQLDLNEVGIGFTINGINASDRSGTAVSSAGDINGDGIDDIIIGAVGANESYVIFGDQNITTSSLELSSLNGNNGFAIRGLPNGLIGQSVSSAGDINGDGIDDVIIGDEGANPNGITNAGQSFVVLGRSIFPFPSSIELSNINGSNGFTINGININDSSGYSVSSAGDINGDGIDDVVIGAFRATTNTYAEGQSYVVFGIENPFPSADPFPGTLELSTLNGSNGFAINGINGGDFSGHSVSNAGDINGDGIDDIIIGAFAVDNSTGESYVVFGSTNPFSSTLELSTLNGSNGFSIRGIEEFDSSNFSVDSAGDINGDGINDLIIGAFGANPNGPFSGESYVVFGTSSFDSELDLSSLDGSNGFTINGIEISDFSGRSVSNAGDVNDDGIDDLIIGAPNASPNGAYSGESYVVFGSRSSFGSSLELSSLNGTNGFIINGIEASDFSGFSVDSAGDINGDGVDDIIIGAYGADPNGPSSGESYVIFGHSNLGDGGVLNLSQIGGLNNVDGIDFEVEFSGTPVVIVANNLSVVDDNSASLVGATVTINNPIDGAAEKLSADTFGTSIVATYDISTGILTLSGTDSLANYQQVLRTITYTNSDPTGTERIIEFILDDGEAHSNTSAIATTTLNFELNQPPVAVADSVTTNEDFLLIGNVFADNGIGVDSDPNGDALIVTALNGEEGDLGNTVTLTSGALLTLNADGTFSYDPNGQFESLADGDIATDSFEYTISDGNGETDNALVTISINGINDSPIVDTAISDLNIDAYSSFRFEVPANTFDDIDGDDLILSASLEDGNLLPDWLNFDPSTNTFSGFPVNTDVASLAIQVTADDGKGGTISDTFELSVSLPLNSTTNTINGNRYGNVLFGTKSNDLINGRGGNDLLLGLQGDDYLFGRNGADILRGGRGSDVLDGGNGSDRLIGNAGNDLLVGGNDFDDLRGGRDNDTLDGGNRADLLFGGNGNDVLIGGRGNDDLYGGSGSDQFVLTPGNGNDTVFDYTDGIDSFGLTNGLTFDDLTITNNVLGNALVRHNGRTLATVLGIDANTLSNDDFLVL